MSRRRKKMEWTLKEWAVVIGAFLFYLFMAYLRIRYETHD